ncbi:hypothetical protein [uncultured Desulfovibrio sp.]|uniref:Uncharacterized protein n=1 Tax=Candidatus Desulfovibrio intestinavium TaxID=2838534 RepID=A0A9D2HLJ2_9BACT|nr:hypothetical protein [uncultured Desulfovibrio sp.]HJA77989.1 hypothetical protein [Candidatus Desulfovibrio intestinavium]
MFFQPQAGQKKKKVLWQTGIAGKGISGGRHRRAVMGLSGEKIFFPLPPAGAPAAAGRPGRGLPLPVHDAKQADFAGKYIT